MPEPALRRIDGCRPAGVVTFSFEGRPVSAGAGESVAAALAVAGYPAMRRTRRFDAARGYFCGMGVCWECVVEVVGVGQRRGCMFAVADGLEIRCVVAGESA
jgi:hypothetical protein